MSHQEVCSLLVAEVELERGRPNVERDCQYGSRIRVHQGFIVPTGTEFQHIRTQWRQKKSSLNTTHFQDLSVFCVG